MKQILIVEDEVAIADLEKDYLELSGFEVEIENDGKSGLERALNEESYGIVSVETAKEAMEVLKSQQFDLVLLDINLPDGNGYAIAKTIREKYCDTSEGMCS